MTGHAEREWEYNHRILLLAEEMVRVSETTPAYEIVKSIKSQLGSGTRAKSEELARFLDIPYCMKKVIEQQYSDVKAEIHLRNGNVSHPILLLTDSSGRRLGQYDFRKESEYAFPRERFIVDLELKGKLSRKIHGE